MRTPQTQPPQTPTPHANKAALQAGPEALQTAAHPVNNAPPITKKPKKPKNNNKQSMEELDAEQQAPENLSEEWDAQAGDLPFEQPQSNQWPHPLQLAQANNGVVSDAGGASASTATTATTAGAAPAAPASFSIDTMRRVLVVLGLAAAGSSSSASTPSSTPAQDTTPPTDTTAPVFTSATSVNVAENTSASTVVHTAAATDNVAVTGYAFETGGADNNKFTLDPTTGELRFNVSPDFETPGSAADSNAYTVMIKATDAAGNSAVQTVTLNVTDVDEVAPTFTAGATASLSVAENTATHTVVHTAAATDNVAVTGYAFADGGADNDKFTLDPTTGELRFKASPDFETPGSAADSNAYTVMIKATDAAGNSAVQTVTLNVTDVDDTAPVFTSATSVNVAENTSASTVVHTAAATDNVAVTGYAFADGGADNDKFTLDPTTGELRFNDSPDFETHGSAAGSNTYTVKIKATDAAGNSAVQTVTLNVTDVDDTAPTFTDGATASLSVDENTATTAVVHAAAATDNVAVTRYAFETGGADNDKFTLDAATGELRFKASPDFETPGSADGSNAYAVMIKASDAAGNSAVQTVTVNVTDVAAPTSAQAFDHWQEAELAWLGDASKNIEALNQYSREIGQQRDTTSRDGSANQTDPAKRLTEWVDAVTGTGIVSQAEYQAGFSITGKAAAGASNIRFYLDNDRTDGANELGVQLQHGVDGVSIAYDSATGEYTIGFAPNSDALLPATHNTWGSGVHQITVDTDGSGTKNDTEASRLFLVASGTAQATDTGQMSQNYSVQDRITNDVFVYYFGDPDGAGIGLWTALDNGDSASEDVVTTDQDADAIGWGEIDYYNTTGLGSGATATPATASNTALHFVTDIAAQTWEFHMGTKTNFETWDVANAQATDHTLWGSNSSRQASLAETVALYAANFGGDGSTRTPNTVGAVQPMSNAGSTNDQSEVEDNRPGGWDLILWTAAPTPSGHAPLNLFHGYVDDSHDAFSTNVSAVL